MNIRYNHDNQFRREKCAKEHLVNEAIYHFSLTRLLIFGGSVEINVLVRVTRYKAIMP
jgi:hypothetical protein